MKVLVTGGAGFIGRHTVELLIARGYEVVVIDQEPGGEALFAQDPGVTYYTADICAESLSDILGRERPAACIHLAAQISVQKSIKDPWMDARTNIMGAIHLLQQCVRYEVNKIVFSSSAAVYGNPVMLPISEDHEKAPLSFYGMSKWVSEKYIETFSERYGLNYAILRYSNVYGMRQSAGGEGGVVSRFIEALLKEKPVTIYGDGSQTRDFIYVKDVAEANIAAMRFGGKEVMNISSGNPISIGQLLGLLGDLIPHRTPPRYEPFVPGDIAHSLLDSRKAQNILGWTPQYTLEEGLRETVNYEASCLHSGSELTTLAARS